MSLQLLAKQMEAKGRGGDSMLVHMTPGEVAGLQKLAESAGGSLTVNPETGLVEANFLKRMLEDGNLLPTLVGAGVGLATMNPYAGAAAGAAVGGIQADQRDQDVLLGAALGGLSGYGAGSLGSGLAAAGSQAAQAGAMQTVAAEQAAQQTAQQAIQNEAAQQAAQQAAQAEAANMLTLGSDQAAQAAFNAQQQELGAQAIQQAADAEAKRFAAQGLGDQASQGISALVDQGSNVGRDAFMSKVGGGAGLMSDVSMAAASPMMAPGKAPGKAPVDDEMYSYTYTPGRTGVERSPLATSAERRYFAGSYSPLRKIKASQYGMAKGGLLSLAEGGVSGTSSEGMTGASKAAFDYLMGRTATTDYEGQGELTRGKGSYSFASNSHMYAFDPVTGQFIRNPNYEDPEVVEERRRAAEAAAAAAAAAAAQSRGGDRDYGSSSSSSSRDDYVPIMDPANPGFVGPRQGEYVPLMDPDNPGFVGPRQGDYVGVMDPENRDFVGPQESPGEGLSGNQNFGGGFDYSGDYDRAEGGLISLAKGGMASGGFVIPADVVSMVGEGNTDAGYKRIKSLIPTAKAIKGKDGGQADTVKTHIDGKQPARVAHGEMYIPPATVKHMGGAKKLYAMMDRVRAQATGSTKQIRPVSLKKAMA